MKYLGDFAASATVRFMWSSNGQDGASITRATNGEVRVYKNLGVTQSTTGVTDTEDFDSLTGVHACAIDTSADGTFYSAGADFTVVLQGATIDGKTVNAVLAEFSIENRSALRPATAGRTLVVDAAGLADANTVKVGPTGSGTAQTAADVGAKAKLAADILEGDETIDKTVSPWNQVVKIKSTSTELVRKKLRKSDGTTGIDEDSDIVGSRTEA